MCTHSGPVAADGTPARHGPLQARDHERPVDMQARDATSKRRRVNSHTMQCVLCTRTCAHIHTHTYTHCTATVPVTESTLQNPDVSEHKKCASQCITALGIRPVHCKKRKAAYLIKIQAHRLSLSLSLSLSPPLSFFLSLNKHECRNTQPTASSYSRCYHK